MSPLVRSAVLTAYADVARNVGLDPYELVRQAGLSAACLVEMDLKIPADAVRQLLEDSAALSQTENFGLRMAQTRRLSILGPLGAAARDAPNLRALLGIVMAHMRVHNETLLLHLHDSGGYCTLRMDLLAPALGPMRQSVELTLGALVRILKIYLGDDWSPLHTCFVHQSPVDPSLHRRMFGAGLAFGADFDGLLCKSSDLDTAIASSDPVMAAYAQRQFGDSLAQSAPPLQHEVRQLILILLPTGRCSIDQVARHLGKHRRTVHRQLADEGCTFSELVAQTRQALSERYLAQAHRPLADIAWLLGFGSAGNYSRWHQAHYGCAPSARRRTLA